MNVMPFSSSAPREGGVLGQEAVAGMDGLGAGLLDHLEQLLDHQVALVGRPGAEQVRLTGALDVLRVAVGLRVDGHRRDAQLVEGADHADRDLAAVGHEHLREHSAAHGTCRHLTRPRASGWVSADAHRFPDGRGRPPGPRDRGAGSARPGTRHLHLDDQSRHPGVRVREHHRLVAARRVDRPVPADGPARHPLGQGRRAAAHDPVRRGRRARPGRRRGRLLAVRVRGARALRGRAVRAAGLHPRAHVPDVPLRRARRPGGQARRCPRGRAAVGVPQPRGLRDARDAPAARGGHDRRRPAARPRARTARDARDVAGPHVRAAPGLGVAGREREPPSPRQRPRRARDGSGSAARHGLRLRRAVLPQHVRREHVRVPGGLLGLPAAVAGALPGAGQRQHRQRRPRRRRDLRAARHRQRPLDRLLGRPAVRARSARAR